MFRACYGGLISDPPNHNPNYNPFRLCACTVVELAFPNNWMHLKLNLGVNRSWIGAEYTYSQMPHGYY